MIKRGMLMGAASGAVMLAAALMPAAAQSRSHGRLDVGQAPVYALQTSSAASWSPPIAGLDTRVSLPAQVAPARGGLGAQATHVAWVGHSAGKSPWPCSRRPVMSSHTNSARTAALTMLALAVTGRSVSDDSAGSAICQPAGR